MIRKNKYNVSAKPTRTLNGVVFDSKKEMQYAQTLNMMLKAKLITDYKMQVPYEIVVNGKKICKYILDFLVTYPDGKIEHIDVKSEMTRKLPVYRLKAKLMLAVHGITIIEK